MNVHTVSSPRGPSKECLTTSREQTVSFGGGGSDSFFHQAIRGYFFFQHRFTSSGKGEKGSGCQRNRDPDAIYQVPVLTGGSGQS